MNGSQEEGRSASAVFYTKVESPVGTLLLAGDERALHQISFENGNHIVTVPTEWKLGKSPFKEAIRQLNAYFGGELKQFDVPLSLAGTEFQLQVWNALRKIPYGETISYAQLARVIENPKAVRAVGLANGQNPVPIIIPCHRVIGSDGSLTGFGGGLSNKKKLLALESKQMVLL